MKFYIGYLLVASLSSYIAYLVDKSRSKRDRRRIPEKTLHLIDLAGGWPGGLAAQKTLRHKTMKRSFQIKYWITVVLHLAIVAGIYQVSKSF